MSSPLPRPPSPSGLRSPRRWRAPFFVGLTAAALTGLSPSLAPTFAAEPAPPPRDPNDTPMLRPPNGQPAPTPIRASPALGPAYSGDRRFALTLAPVYASFRLPLRERPTIRRPGVGGVLEADLRLLSFAWLRAQIAYSAHPIDETKIQDPETEEVQQIANAGTLHATTAGLGIAAGLDLGRFLPLIDLGAGVTRIGTPEGALAGQRGQACIDGNLCDTGLRCSAGSCVPRWTPTIHAGVSIDLQLGARWSVGAALRYFALLAQPMEIPIYVIGGARVGLRF